MNDEMSAAVAITDAVEIELGKKEDSFDAFYSSLTEDDIKNVHLFIKKQLSPQKLGVLARKLDKKLLPKDKMKKLIEVSLEFISTTGKGFISELITKELSQSIELLFAVSK